MIRDVTQKFFLKLFEQNTERVYTTQKKRFFKGLSNKMSVSLREVADVAGVSLSTVSEVLNNSGRARIGEETRIRVRDVARELGYQPNRMARSLITGRTQTIGLMISGLQNPFFVLLIEAIERGVADAGYQAILDSAPSHLGSYREHGKLSQWPVDGVLMWASGGDQLSDYLGTGAATKPVVYIGGAPREIGDCVRFDMERGARQAAQFLIERGYKRIAHVLPYPVLDEAADEPRRKGFREACDAANIELQVIVTQKQEETLEAGWLTGQHLASRSKNQRPQALLCHNDVLAIGICHGLRRSGLRIPEDIAVVGCDGIPDGRFLESALTTIEIPVLDLAQSALKILLLRLAGETFPTQHKVFPTTLRIGETA